MVVLGLGGGEEGEEKGKENKGRKKGREGKGGTNEIPVFIVPYILLRNYVLSISIVY
jgi:hypothetical protein